jgi:uncharacterized protein (DUF4213/DUF364 family)
MYTTHNLHSVCVSDAAADVVTPTVTATVEGTSVAADDTVCATVDTAGDDFTVVFCGGNAVFVAMQLFVLAMLVVCSVVVTDVVTSVTVVTESVVTAIPKNSQQILSVVSKQANNIHIYFSSSY